MSIVERNKSNGSKGGRPKSENPKEPKEPTKLTGLFGNPKEPTKPDNDNEYDNEYVDDNDSHLKKKETSPKGESKKDELSLNPHPQIEHVDFVRLQEYFNTTFNGKLSMVVNITEARRKAVKARIAQYDKETVFTVLKKVAASPFLLGCNDRNWKCDFDWIFKAGNFTKILEGNYDEKRNNNTAGGRKESVSRLKGLAEAILTDSET